MSELALAAAAKQCSVAEAALEAERGKSFAKGHPDADGRRDSASGSSGSRINHRPSLSHMHVHVHARVGVSGVSGFSSDFSSEDYGNFCYITDSSTCPMAVASIEFPGAYYVDGCGDGPPLPPAPPSRFGGAWRHIRHRRDPTPSRRFVSSSQGR